MGESWGETPELLNFAGLLGSFGLGPAEFRASRAESRSPWRPQPLPPSPCTPHPTPRTLASKQMPCWKASSLCSGIRRSCPSSTRLYLVLLGMVPRGAGGRGAGAGAGRGVTGSGACGGGGGEAGRAPADEEAVVVVAVVVAVAAAAARGPVTETPERPRRPAPPATPPKGRARAGSACLRAGHALDAGHAPVTPPARCRARLAR